jgi:hypothetical protein
VNAQLITEAEVVEGTYLQDKRGMGLIRLRRNFYDESAPAVRWILKQVGRNCKKSFRRAAGDGED